MTVITHDESLKDRAVMAAMRAALAVSPALELKPESRAAYDELMAQVPIAVSVGTTAGEVGGTPGWWCRPANAAPQQAILYLHGGGYVIGSAAAYRGLGSQIAARTGVATFVADYALAPERPFPAAYEDARRALEALIEATGGKVAVVGDSAGGGLALGLLVNCKPASPRPAAAAVFSPMIDATLSSRSLETRANSDPILSRETLQMALQLYLDGGDRSDARVNALHGDFSSLPPIRIDVGDEEVLLDDSVQFHDRAQREGQACDVHGWKGMTHVFPANVSMLGAATDALDVVASFLRQELGRRAATENEQP